MIAVQEEHANDRAQHYCNDDRRDFATGIGEIDRIIVDVDIRVQRLRQRYKSWEQITCRETSCGRIMLASV